MTPETPDQPPAAPESDVRLTEAEREAVNVAVDEAETCVCCGDDYGSTHVYEAVERIVAERVRVVEGERDALIEERNDLSLGWVEEVARAEKAEAERDRAEAAHRALQAAVEALADDFDSNVDWSAGRNNYGDNEAWESAARQARALAGGAR
jgi:trehalose-6-phosphatase